MNILSYCKTPWILQYGNVNFKGPKSENCFNAYYNILLL